MTQYWCLVDGQVTDALPPHDRGLAYGDGVFETIRLNPQPVLFVEHLERLYEGCRRLAIPVEANLLQAHLNHFIADKGAGVLKIIVTRGAGGRGYAASTGLTPTIILVHSRLPDYPVAHYQDGIDVAVADLQLTDNPRLAGIKHLNRLEQVLARMEAPVETLPELLLTDQRGYLVEGVVSNLFVVKHHEILTPPLEHCGVAGTLRGWLLDELRRLSVPARVAAITVDELKDCTEVFVANSVFGIWPVRSCGPMRWLPGPLTRRCQQHAAAWFAMPGAPISVLENQR